MQAIREWPEILNVLNRKNMQARYPARLSFRIQRKIKAFPDRQKLKEFKANHKGDLMGDSVSRRQQRLQKKKYIITIMTPTDNTMTLNPSFHNHSQCKWTKFPKKRHRVLHVKEKKIHLYTAYKRPN